MGLFDDPSALLSFLNPMGTANAQPSNMSVQTPGLNPDDLIASQATKPPLAPPLPTGSVPPAGMPYGPAGAPNMALPAPPVAPPQITPAVGGNPPQPPMFNDTSGLPPQRNLGRAGLDDVPVPPPALPLGSGDGSVGAALTGGDATTPPGATPTTGTGATPKALAANANPTLAAALKGVVAPPAPVLQKISSPSPPKPTGQIKGGELMALLQALNAGAPNMARGLPTTLGGK